MQCYKQIEKIIVCRLRKQVDPFLELWSHGSGFMPAIMEQYKKSIEAYYTGPSQISLWCWVVQTCR
jgi:hypothetical protein